MKRMLTLTLVLALVLVLSLPAAAFAKRGGVPANGKGKAATVEATADGTSEDVAPEVRKDKEKKKDKVAGEDVLEDIDVDDEADLPDTEVGDDVAGEPAEKLTGIENALSRLQRNLARKQAAFDAGLRQNLPAGLQATIAKFMSWLGMEPADEAVEGDDASIDTSETVEPAPVEDPADEPVVPETPAETP